MVGKNGPTDDDNAKRRRDEFLQRRGMSGDPPGEDQSSDQDAGSEAAKSKDVKQEKARPPRK